MFILQKNKNRMRHLGLVCLLPFAALVTASKDSPSKLEDANISARVYKSLVQHTLAYVGSGMLGSNPYAFESLMLMNQRMDNIVQCKYKTVPNQPMHSAFFIYWDILEKSSVIIILHLISFSCDNGNTWFWGLSTYLRESTSQNTVTLKNRWINFQTVGQYHSFEDHLSIFLDYVPHPFVNFDVWWLKCFRQKQ